MRVLLPSLVLVLANSTASSALGLTARAGAAGGDSTALSVLALVGAPLVGGGLALLLGPAVALGGGAALVTLACLSVPFFHGLEIAVALGMLGHNALLAIAVGCIAAGLCHSDRYGKAAGLVALWTGHLLAVRLTEASPWAETSSFWLSAATATVMITGWAIASLKPTAPAAKLEPRWTSGAARGALAGLVAFPVAFGAELRPAAELGRLAPAAAARELALHRTGEIVASLLVVAILLAKRPPRPSRLAALSLLGYAVSIGLSPAMLGVQEGPLLAPLQVAGNLVEGTGVLLVPLGVCWIQSGYSSRAAAFVTGVFFAVWGTGQAAGRAALGQILATAHSPRVALVFLALLAATLAFAEGIAIGCRTHGRLGTLIRADRGPRP